MSSAGNGQAVTVAAWLRSVITGALRALTQDDTASVVHPAPDVLTFTLPAGITVHLQISITREGGTP